MKVLKWVSARKGQRSNILTRKQLVVVSTLVLGSFILYILGARLFFVPVLVGVSVWRLAMPRIFASWLSRVIAALLLLAGLLQVSSSLQFLLLPDTGFNVLALIVLFLLSAVWLLAPSREAGKRSIISANDICGAVIVACVLLPFAQAIVGHNGIQKLADIGTVQSSDGVRHYLSIENMMQTQHLEYTHGNYYPSGFYTAAAFVQSTFFHDQFELGWRDNVYLYFGDYLFYAAMLGYLLYYLCITWLKALNDKLVPEGWAWSKLLVALCLAPPLVVLYLLPFVSEAFLSYYYVCITFVCALLFLSELRPAVASSTTSLDLTNDNYGRWWLLAYLILVYGVSMTWPLLIPPFAVSGFLFLVPSRLQGKIFIRRVVTVRGMPVIAAFMIQLVPIYFQLKYSAAGTTQGINATGGLTQFHAYVLLFGGLLVAGTVVASKVDSSFRRSLVNIFFPMFVFLGALMFFQYFTVGAILYYVIKISLLVEMLLLSFGVAVLVSAFAKTDLYETRYAWMLPALPFFVMLLLVSSINNPLKDIRDTFRIRSNDPIPQFFSQDTQLYLRLGESSKLHHFNMTTLHYDSSQGKFFGNMQGPYWVDVMQYDASTYDRSAFNCVGSLYYNLAFGNFSAADQIELAQNIKQCAIIAKQQGGKFYVVTDAVSAPHVRTFVGPNVSLVY